MPQYRKKPVVIEAVQWKGEALSDSKELRSFLFSGKDTPYSISQYEDDVLVVRTLEGEMLAKPGDWIIRGVAGELYPCKPEIFEATYQPMDDSTYVADEDLRIERVGADEIVIAHPDFQWELSNEDARYIAERLAALIGAGVITVRTVPAESLPPMPPRALQGMLEALIEAMRKAKPNDRSPADRNWAVALTEMEKVLAYWAFLVVMPLEAEATAGSVKEVG